MQTVRFSHLRAYGRSPLHGWHARTQAELKPSAAMELGSAVDALLFKHKGVVGYPGAQRRGKEYEAFASAHADGIILTMAEFTKANRMADAISSCKAAEPLLKGTYQKTILFDWNGMPCRATPDVIGDGFLTELKTSASSDPAKFAWHALRMSYHAQMRMQNIACRDSALDHYIVCCEAEDPHPVTVFRFEQRALDAGEKLLVLWSETLKNCEASQHFPPYSSAICPIDVPDDEIEYDFGGNDAGN